MKLAPRLLRKECPYKVLVKMKIIVVILVALASLQVHAGGYAQNTVTLSERNSTLIKVFKQIKKQTGYSYILTSDLLAQAGKVNIEVTNATLTDALEMIFREQPLTYSIVGRTIVVKGKEEPKKIAAAVEVPGGLPIDVRGRVVNEKGEPVEGVTVTVKGTKKITITNANGEFSLATVDPEAVLVFTSVNMETFEYEVSGKADLVINVRAKVTALRDVVVSVNTGYQTLKPNEVTGSVATVSREQLDRRVATNIISKLEGITSGLVFNRNRAGGTSLSIRGLSTIFASSDPLIVIDNFPYEGNLNNINPNDIESVTVLKDAGAASIWGVRAGNGVIVITTKKGRFDQPLHIELNSNITIGAKPDLFYGREFLNASDFIDVETALYKQGFYNSDFTSSTKVPISPVVEFLNQRKLGLITPADSAARIDALRSLDVRNELSKYFYQKPTTQQYSLNISAGNAKMAFLFSAGYDKAVSHFTQNGNDRITLNFTNTLRLIKNLEIFTGINYTQSSSENNSIVSQLSSSGGSKTYQLSPYTQFADINGDALPILKGYRTVYTDTVGGGRLLNWKYYPLDELNYADNTTKLFDTRINAGLKYTIIKGLSAEMKYQYEKGINQTRQLQSIETYYTRDLINRFTAIRPGGVLKYNIPVGGILDMGNSNLNSSAFRLQASYNYKAGEHNLSVIGGTEMREVINDNNRNRTYGYDPLVATFSYVNYDSTYSLIPAGTGTVPRNDIALNNLVDRNRSYFANAAYSYKNYSLSMSGRIDQSNLFGVNTNQKSVPLWSVGGKWKISGEKRYRISWLPELSFRATYGYNGNLNKTLSAYLTSSYFPTPGTINNNVYAVITNPGNRDLRWEKISMVNIGLDFEIGKKDVAGSIEYFHKKGIDLIGETPVPSSTGVTSAKINYANMTGRGIDINLSWNILKRNFKWNVGILSSYAIDKVTKYNVLPSAQPSGQGFTVVVGKPVFFVSAFPWAGLDPVNGDPMGYLADTVTKAYGNLINLKADQQVYIGPANPVWYGALSNTFSWKGLTLYFNISYKAGYYFKRSSLSYTSLFNSWIGHVDYADRWQKKGDESNTNVPSFPTTLNNTNRDFFYLNSEAIVVKGDHIRFQDISLSYDFDKWRGNKLPLSQLRLYLYVNNVGILWRANKYGIDPDYQSVPPAPRTISIGLRAGI